MLTPLSQSDVAKLVQTMFGGVPNSLRLARWLSAEGGANPRQCLGLVGWLLDRGAARCTRGTFALPHDVETDASIESGEALQANRLARTGRGPVLLARLLALAGRPLGVSQLSEASGAPPSTVLEDLRVLQDAALIVEAEGSYALASSGLGNTVTVRASREAVAGAHRAVRDRTGRPPARPRPCA